MEYPWSSFYGTPWRIHGQYHRKSMGIHMGLSWSIPGGQYHGFSMDFWVVTMVLLYLLYRFSRYFPWSIHGISSGVFEYGHRKKHRYSRENLWCLVESPWDTMEYFCKGDMVLPFKDMHFSLFRQALQHQILQCFLF